MTGSSYVKQSNYGQYGSKSKSSYSTYKKGWGLNRKQKNLGYIAYNGFTPYANGILLKVKYTNHNLNWIQTCATSVASSYVWAGNSIFHPDRINGAGTGFLGKGTAYEQSLENMYYSYYVTGSLCNVSGAVSTDALAGSAWLNYPVQMNLYPTAGLYNVTNQASPGYSQSTQSATTPDYIDIANDCLRQKLILGTYAQQAGKNFYNLSKYAKTKYMLRGSDEQSLSGLTGTSTIATSPNLYDPADMWFWMCQLIGTNTPAGSTNYTVVGDVDITYYTIFFNRKVQSSVA